MPAQDPAPVGPGSHKIQQQTAEMRLRIEDRLLVRSHVRVRVRLKNGNRFTGIVKDGRLVERVDGLKFVQAEEGELGTGIRLWYHNNVASFVFLPFTEIHDYAIGERLTSAQVHEIERRLIDAEKLQKEAAGRGPGDPAAPGTGANQPPGEPGPTEGPAPGFEPVPPPVQPVTPATPATPAKTGGTKEATPPAEDAKLADNRRLFALLQEYPPAQGWSAARRGQIERKQAVIHVPPTPEEKRFLEVFADWQRAVEIFQPEMPEAPETGNGRRNRRNR